MDARRLQTFVKATSRLISCRVMRKTGLVWGDWREIREA